MRVIKRILVESFLTSDKLSFVVLYKDALVTISRVMEQLSTDRIEQNVFKKIRSFLEPDKRPTLKINAVAWLAKRFTEKFMELA